MSSNQIVENIKQMSGGRPVSVLEFTRKYKTLASEISKAIPSTERVARDGVGNRKMTAPDFSSLMSTHRNISRRNHDAKLTMQMLPDLKLALNMIVSLIMSPKDAFSNEIIIRSDSLNLLPASIMQTMIQVVTEYYRKNYDLSEFTQHMLEQTLGFQGALPVLVIPENSLDDLVNNYNANITLESFKREIDFERNIPHPINLLGVPDYLTSANNKNTETKSGLLLGKDVRFDLQSFDRKRATAGRVQPSSSNASMRLSRLIGDPSKPWTFEQDGRSHDADELVVVTDNISVLKLQGIRGQLNEAQIGDTLKKRGFDKLAISLESVQKQYKEHMSTKVNMGGKNIGRVPSDSEVEALIYKDRRFAYTPVGTLRSNSQLKRNSVGEPMVKQISHSCVIPVGVDGDPTRKLGCWVALDEEGVPLTDLDMNQSQVIDLSAYAGGSGSFVSTMNERSNSVMNGRGQDDDMPTHLLKKFLTRTFGEVVDKDRVERLKTGHYQNGSPLASTDDVNWLTFTRCMRGQRTQFLWVPEEFMIYFAMDYDEMGFGISLFEEIRNITSMRIMLMVAGIAASLRNSIGRTKVTIKLDEHDPDADKSIEDIQDEILKSRMNPLPFGVNNVADISKYLQRSCYEFEISGSNAIPDMAVGFEQFNSQYPKPDQELQDDLKDLSIQHFTLTRDMIDAASGVDFAIQAATSNMMTMKRVLRWQRKATPQVTQLVRTISRNSEQQITALREILENNFDTLQVQKLKTYFNIEDEEILKDEKFKKLVIEQCLNEFLNQLTVELPSPASTTLEAQQEAFNNAATFYKEALEYVLNESFFDTSVQGEGLSDHVDMMKNIILSHLMRDYMAKNAILPELSDLTTLDEDGKVAMNMMDELEKHIMALGLSTGNFFTRFKDFAIKQTAVFQNVGDSSTDGTTEPDSGGGGGGDSGGEGGGEFGDDSEFDIGGDPLGGGEGDGEGGDANANPDGEGGDAANPDDVV